MATRPKAVIESRNGEKLSPITIAKNVLTDDGQNLHDILSDRKEDMMTPTIENSSSMFKVGQGDDVDYSANVVNGAYESMVLKGKTMVNCIQEPSSQDVVLPYEFEDGQYVTINDTKESGALGVELKGQTLVNLLNNKYSYCNLPTSEEVEMDSAVNQYDANNNRVKEINLNQNLQANKKYVIVLNITQLESGKRISGFSTKATSGEQIYDIPSFHSTGLKCITYTPQNDVKRVSFYLDQNVENPTIAKIKQPMIIEYQEGMENWDIPYFKGMASCKMPTLHTVGNLFDAQKIIPNNTFTYSHSTNIGRFEFTNRGDVVVNTNIQLPVGTYDISFSIRGVCGNGRVAITFAKDGQVWHNCSRVEINYGEFDSTTFKEVKVQLTFDAPVIVTIAGHAWAGGATGSGWCEFKDIRFTPVGKSSILSLPEEIVLRSLPNGVCDTFNTRTGVYTQRIWSATFNGTESYSVWESSSVAEGMAGIYTRTKVNDKIVTSENEDGQILCDTLPTTHRNQLASCKHDSVVKGNNYIGFTMKGKTSEEIKQWLSGNPTTVCCELKTPIIKKINLSSTLKSWNTTTHIYSEIPENTLYPILSHLNPTYPVILKPSTKYSIVANSYSNSHTNSAINFNLGGATASTTVGNRVTTITTPSTLSNELLTMSGRGNKLKNVMVIEGDVVGDEPYFEGMCDSKSPILSNVMKNLVNVDNYVNYPNENLPIIKDGEHSYIIENKKVGNWQNRVVDKVKLKANTTYTLSYDYELLSASVPMNYGVVINLRDDSDTSTNISGDVSAGKPRTFTPTRDTLARLCMYATDNSGGMNRIKFSNIQLEESSNRTEYEPYKSNILSTPEEVVLRSLSNGVCDTLNVETGEYIKRIGEIVLDNSHSSHVWNMNADWSMGDIAVFWSSNVVNMTGNSVLCDKFPSLHRNELILNNVAIKEAIRYGVTSVQFFIRKSRLETPDVAGFKRWLSQNPVTIQYELTTPIVSTIDIQGFPYAYTNGHVILSSGSIEQSLTPKVEYSVVTNRNGQIRSNQKMVERHQKQLDRLQAMILTNLVNTQYEQALTNLKYDLKNVRGEVK